MDTAPPAVGAAVLTVPTGLALDTLVWEGLGSGEQVLPGGAVIAATRNESCVKQRCWKSCICMIQYHSDVEIMFPNMFE